MSGADETQKRRELSQLRSRLEARERNQSRLELAQGELRAALHDLREAVARERGRRAALEAELSAALVERDAAIAELADLREELTRLGGALAVAREDEGDSELAELEALLAETRALTASLAEDRPGPGADGHPR